MKGLATPVKVGLLVVLGLVAFFVFFTFVSGGGMKGKAVTYHAVFTDASGLAPLTQVRVAGIPVGEITSIELVEGRAKINIQVKDSVPVYANARLSKRSESILGDYLLDLGPGAPATPGEAPLPSGSEIRDVKEAVALEQLFESLNRITADIQAVTRSLREALAGDENALQKIVEDLERVAATIEKTISGSTEKLDRILDNAEAVSADVRAITRDKDRDIQQIVTNVRVITEQTRSVLDSVKGIVGSNETDLKESVGGVKDALASLNRSLASLENVSSKIEKGEGTLGKLVADEELAQKVEGTVEDASEFVGRLVRLQTEVTLRSELLLNERGAKNYLSLKLIPKPDKYYLVEVIDDPRGLVEREVITRSPPGAEEAANQEVRVTREALKFSAQFAKRYYFATFRFGIIESTGGLGANLHFLDDHLELKLDAFEFASPDKDYPRIKAYANFLFLNHLFVTAGADDIINPAEVEATTGRILSGRDYFFGGGIYFTDDDLKAILTFAPSP